MDDLLKELLTSPLEKPPRRSRRRTADTAGGSRITPDGSDEAGTRPEMPRVPLVWGLGAAVLGATIVIAGYSIAKEDPASATTTTTTTTVAATVDDGSPSGLPTGYEAVGDRLGMRVERILSRPDGVFVTITTVAINSLDPDATTGYQGGLWTLVLEDGRRITSTIESFDPLARGTVSIEFAPGSYVGADIVSIELNGIATRMSSPFGAESVSTFTPTEDGTSVSLTPDQFGIDNGVTMSLDAFRVTADGASLEWSLGGDATATATMTPTLTVFDAAGTAIDVPLHVQSSGFDNFHPSIPGPILSTAGVVGFRMPDGFTLPLDTELRAVIEASVTWVTYDPIVVRLPVFDGDVTEVAG